MKVVCAWCQKSMGEKEPFEDSAVSHGLCEGCMTDVLEESGLQPEPERLECPQDEKSFTKEPAEVANETAAIRNVRYAPLDDGSVDDGAGPTTAELYP